MSPRVTASFCSARLFAAAAAWALHQQAGYVLKGALTGGSAAPGIWISAAGAFSILFIGGLLSLIALRSRLTDAAEKARPRRFLARVGVMAAALFLFAVALQAGAAFCLPGCVG